MPAYLNAIATAVPQYQRHAEFVDSLPHWIPSGELVEKIRQIIAKSGIERRYTVLDHPLGFAGSGAFYEYGRFPSTHQRMLAYRREALPLALQAVRRLPPDMLANVTHLVVTSCTGFYAPGIDIDLVRELNLSSSVKRSIIGFMGCYAGLTGLRHAREIVQADAAARVLMVNVELCSLHLQQTEIVDRLVSFLLFADGAAASIISSDEQGMRIDNAYSHLSLVDADRMGWLVEDQGFAMILDSRVPARIRQLIKAQPAALELESLDKADQPALWAVHPGGRAILDAVQDACSLSDAQMACSRSVLRDFGNMSSATIMFALQRLMEMGCDVEENGRAIAFGPGLTLEGISFTKLPCPAAAVQEMAAAQMC